MGISASSKYDNISITNEEIEGVLEKFSNSNSDDALDFHRFSFFFTSCENVDLAEALWSLLADKNT